MGLARFYAGPVPYISSEAHAAYGKEAERQAE